MHEYIHQINNWYDNQVPPLDSTEFARVLGRSMLSFEAESGSHVAGICWNDRILDFRYAPTTMHVPHWLFEYHTLGQINPEIEHLPLAQTVLGLWNGMVFWEGTRWRLFPVEHTSHNHVLKECYRIIEDEHIFRDQKQRFTRCFTHFTAHFLGNEYAFANAQQALANSSNEHEALAAILALTRLRKTQPHNVLWQEPIWEDIATTLEMTSADKVLDAGQRLYDLIQLLLQQSDMQMTGAISDKAQQNAIKGEGIEDNAENGVKQEKLRHAAGDVAQHAAGILRYGHLKVIQGELEERSLPDKMGSVRKDKAFEGLAHAITQIRAPRAVRSTSQEYGKRPHRHLIHRISTTGRIFAQTEQINQLNDPEVIMLLDLSESMVCYDILLETISAAWAAHDSLWQTGIPVQTWAFTSFKNVRTHPTLYQIAQNKSQPEAWARALRINSHQTPTGFVIKAAGTKFRHAQRQHVMLVWTDGEPFMGSSYMDKVAEDHTRAEIHQLRKRNIKVISVSLIRDVIRSNNNIFGAEFNVDASGDISQTTKELVRAIATEKR